MTSPLPTPQSFLTNLLSALSSQPSDALPANIPPLSSDSKSPLLTLHCLFPSDLLPALDLLDRRLITRLVLQQDATPTSLTKIDPQAAQSDLEVYYVRSSQRSRYPHENLIGSNYEVRLQAWNCTCPAFTFAAFGFDGEESPSQAERSAGYGSAEAKDGWFGGLQLGQGFAPICKHLLACVLLERCGKFEDLVDKRILGREEMAGWAAGWPG